MLVDLEKGWGGTIEERMESKMAAYRAKKNLEKAIAENPPRVDAETESGAGE